MALTRPRAAQIYDIDYKQATRVVTVANITLTGGAPNQVDGVNLSLKDRVLVTGQSTANQNGIYYVTTVGSGSNGTWTRSLDTNETGEILSGTIVMVTEGIIYADTQWKLTTDDPITVGVTAQTWVQNYSANSISGGNSNVTVLTNANILLSSTGTANVVDVFGTGIKITGTESVTGNIQGGNILTGGVISATGNITGDYLLGNIYFANGFSASKIFNGNSEVNVVSSGGNVNVSIGSTSNVAVFATTGEYITGELSASGNVTAGNILTAGVVSATGNVTAGNILTAGVVSATGNATAGNILTAGVVSATGNITGDYFLGNVFFANGITASKIYSGNSEVNVTASGGNVNVSIGGTSNVVVWSTAGEYVTGLITATGNVTGGNVLTAGLISAAGNITGNYLFGNAVSVTGVNTFSSIAVSGANTIVANTISTELTLAAGNNIVLTTDDSTNTLTIAYSSLGSSIFATGGDMGLISQPVTASEDLGDVTTLADTSYDLGTLFVSNTFNQIDMTGFTSNINTGNLNAVGLVSAAGNVYGANVITNGLQYITPNYITVSANGTSNLSATNTTNILLVTTTGLTATLNMPALAGNGQVCSIAVSGNTATLAVGTGTVNSTFAGSATVGTTFKYVYNTGTATWYRIV